MLSAFRKSSAATADHARPSIASMPYDLRQKFKWGVDYNMKILIRGDRNVGKSCLLCRLQGGPFVETYQPTEEIQVASIAWNYKATDTVIKVEIWDVVDQSRRRRPMSNALKIGNTNLQVEEPALDATFVHVLQGASGIILMFDITKAWTWDYVKRELPLVPFHLPVLILGNKRDLESSRTVAEHQCRVFVNQLQRPADAGTIYYSECSMLSGLGLKLIYVFLNVPFLMVERESLTKQLNRNQTEMQLTFEELKLYDTVSETNQKISSSVTDQTAAAAKEDSVRIVCRDANGSKGGNDILQKVDLDSWLDESEGSKIEIIKSGVQIEQSSDSDDDQPNPLVTQIPTDDSGTEDQ